MRKLVVLLFAAAFFSALMGTNAAVADDDSKRQQMPDSIVTCQGLAGGYTPINVTTNIELNLVDCTFIDPLRQVEDRTPVIPVCSSCVRSLEKQGCKVLDVVITNFPPASGGGAGIPNFPVGIAEPRASFVLSCERP